MKKIIGMICGISLLCLTMLMGLTLVACSQTSAGAGEATAAPATAAPQEETTTTAARSEEPATAAPAAEPTLAPTGESSEVPGDVGDALAGILQDLSADVHEGTAGSSLTAAVYAGKILDWSLDAKTADETAAAVTKQVYGALDASAAAEFPDQLASVYAAAQQLCGDTGADLLESCGYQAVGYPWDAAAMESLFAAMTGAVK